MAAIDLNADLGEGMSEDAELTAQVTSANVACGFHAGDVETMAVTVRRAREHRVAVGAHPSYRDRENFGRSPMNPSPDALQAGSAYLNHLFGGHIAQLFAEHGAKMTSYVRKICEASQASTAQDFVGSLCTRVWDWDRG